MAFTCQAESYQDQSSALDAAQQASAKGDLLLFVGNSITGSGEQNALVLGAALATSPGSVESIVRVSIQSGATAEEIAAQCRAMLTSGEIIMLAAAAISEQTNPGAYTRLAVGSAPVWIARPRPFEGRTGPGNPERSEIYAYNPVRVEPIIISCIRALPRGVRAEFMVAVLKAADVRSYEAILITAAGVLGVDSPAEVSAFIDGILRADVRLSGEEVVPGFLDLEMEEHILTALLTEEETDFGAPPETEPPSSGS